MEHCSLEYVYTFVCVCVCMCELAYENIRECVCVRMYLWVYLHMCAYKCMFPCVCVIVAGVAMMSQVSAGSPPPPC